MSGDDPRRILLKVCHQFYRRDLSHTEIARNLGISRFQVARLLHTALEQGYVTVNILEPERWHSDLENAIEERYGIRTAIVVDGEDVDDEELRSRVADAAGRYLADNVSDGSVVGISLGETVHRMIRQLPDRLAGKAEVVQLIGGSARVLTEVSSMTLAIDLARRFGTEPHLLFAPAVVEAEQRGSLLLHDDLRSTFEKFTELDVAVLGIGSLTRATTSRLLYGGVIDDRLHRELLEAGAVADLLSYVLGPEGEVLSTDLDGRTISIPLDDLRRTPCRIGVASGWEKGTAVRAVLLAGLVNVLVTDSRTASVLVHDEH
jgi:deoxyribonucleoside regulator